MSADSLAELERNAKSAVTNLSSPSLNQIVIYLDALGQDIARAAMKETSAVNIRKRQGEHAALNKLADLLRGSATTPQRSKLRSV